MKCLLLSFLFIPIISIAQQDIPNAQAGKCYAKCLLPFTEKDAVDKAEGKAVQISMAKWIEVLCNDKITSKIIRQIKLELVDKEYFMISIFG
jgi:hypothetical protein